MSEAVLPAAVDPDSGADAAEVTAATAWMPKVVPVMMLPPTVVVTVAGSGVAVVLEQPDHVPVHEEKGPHPAVHVVLFVSLANSRSMRIRPNLPRSSARTSNAIGLGAPRTTPTTTITHATASVTTVTTPVLAPILAWSPTTRRGPNSSRHLTGPARPRGTIPVASWAPATSRARHETATACSGESCLRGVRHCLTSVGAELCNGTIDRLLVCSVCAGRRDAGIDLRNCRGVTTDAVPAGILIAGCAVPGAHAVVP